MSTAANPWADFFDASTYYTSPPLNDAMIAAAERAVGYTLSQSYLRLLRAKNGGVPKRQCYPTGGTDWSDNHVRVTKICGIGGMWGIDSEDFGSRHMIEQAGFPEVGIYVGMTPTAGHDGVFLDYSECGPQGEPRVTFIDSESGDTHVLAADFETFLRGLVDCKPYDDERDKAMEEFRRQSQGGK
jgi:hypothetical protein